MWKDEPGEDHEHHAHDAEHDAAEDDTTEDFKEFINVDIKEEFDEFKDVEEFSDVPKFEEAKQVKEMETLAEDFDLPSSVMKNMLRLLEDGQLSKVNKFY